MVVGPSSARGDGIVLDLRLGAASMGGDILRKSAMKGCEKTR